MNILLVCATKKEIEPFLKSISSEKRPDVLITGPGMISTIYHLTKKLDQKKYDLAINAGIAGCFSKEIALGTIVNTTEECFSELGAEDDENFIPLIDLKLEGIDDFPLRHKTILNSSEIKSNTLSKIPQVKGITVNKVHGNEKNIVQVKNLFHPDVETMEGAAFFYVCSKERIPFAQIRAISNYIEKRNKSAWKIQLATSNLSDFLKKFFDEINL